MIKSCISISLIASLFFVMGCGASNAQKGKPSSTNAQGPAATPPANSGIKPIITSNMNSASANLSSGSGQVDRRGTRSRQGERADVDPSATPPPMAFQKAPENSEFGTSMEANGIVLEKRVFKGHPQLRSAEITWTDPQTRSLKVTLKNGKIVERKGVGTINLRTISSAELLNIIGIKSGSK